MNNRHLQLAFDGNKQEKIKVKIGISQGSLVSPILFLIYIRNIFLKINIMHIRSPSYMDNIALSHFSKSIENNCKMLGLVVGKLLQLQGQNNIQFNMEKIELIHFHSKRIDNYQDYIVQIGNIQVKPKNLVR